MKKLRDSQKSKVYKADDLLLGYWHEFERQGVFSSLESVGYWVKYQVVGSAWWKQYRTPLVMKGQGHRPRKPPAYIIVKDGRGRRSACGMRGYDGRQNYGVIKLPRWARTKPIILHELAHTIAHQKPAHGRQFCRIYLDLIERFMGDHYAHMMKGIFKILRVKWRKERKDKK